MYAKFINETKIEKAPKMLYIDGTGYVNPTEDIYNRFGYKIVVDDFQFEQVIDQETGDTSIQEQPAPKWYHYEDRYTNEEKQITHTHITVKDTAPEYSELIVHEIRKVYSLNDELAIQRQRNNSEEKAQEFANYNAFCDDAKLTAKAIIKEYEEA